MSIKWFDVVCLVNKFCAANKDHHFHHITNTNTSIKIGQKARMKKWVDVYEVYVKEDKGIDTFVAYFDKESFEKDWRII